MEDLNYYLSQLIDGIAYGSVYGILALSIVLLYRANKLFNFAQTEIAMLFVCGAASLLSSLSFYLVIALLIILSFLGGGLLHFGVMRFVTERRHVSKIHESVITIGLFTFFNSLNTYLFGDDPRPFPSAFGNETFQIKGISFAWNQVGILAVTMLMILTIGLFFKFSRIGMTFEAVAENIEAAKLRGIRASNILAFSWAFAIMTSAVGGILIAPVLFVTPNMLVSIYAYSLIAVVIGGIESPFGALVGGLIVGVVENLSSNASFIGADLKFVAVSALLLVILLVRPRGLWGRTEGRRV